MRAVYTFFVLMILCCSMSLRMTAQVSACEELFISEFLEGDLLNKALEVYNPTENTKDLNGYTLSVYANGSSEATFIHELTGQLESHETYVICNAGALQPVLDIANATSDVCSFNGNDAVVLALNGVALDVIGVVGEDPLGTWAVGSGATENYTLVRKSNVQVPTTNWSESENQIEYGSWHTETLGNGRHKCERTF